MDNQKIIVAPLNWGLGHASRCVPIIKTLLKQNFIPIIASDGKVLLFLQQEFPELESIALPSYHIKYGKYVKLNLLLQIPKILRAVKNEKKVVDKYIKENKDVVGIISDNRFGARNTKVTSVYITHQLNVLAGLFTFFTSKIHQQIIKKFDECWIPDTCESTFSGKLSSTKSNITSKYIGVLSRFQKENVQQDIDYLVLLSGPEPNRTFLEKRLTKAFKHKKHTVFVLGKVAKKQKKWKEQEITFYNFLLTEELQKLINSSKLVVCRSGYSSIMDLAVLEKKAFFIPTKNQSEQEYLAAHLSQKKIAGYCKEEHFSLEQLNKVENFKGLKIQQTDLDIDLDSLFQRK